ncbi:MAG: guanylate kinase [Actinobacteria bacterium]|nr:MAG: guanylate kinase [Actinomycetota bacterium]
MRTGNLFIVSGPSGAGKGTLVEALLDRVPDIWVSVSATTRAPRPGEQEGVSYFFLTPHEFERRAAGGEFLESATVHGSRYGTLRGPVERRIRAGMQVVLEIDPQGARQVLEQMPEAILIFVKTRSIEDLKRRLRARGTETEAQVELRLRNAERELGLVSGYKHVVINDDVERAIAELVGIIDSYAERDS